MSHHDDHAAPPNAPYGGYAITRLREAGGDETTRFEATLTHHGQPIARVSNGGTGGSHTYRALRADGWAAIDAFGQYAQGWNLESPYSGWCDDDQLVDRLISVARLNRMRRTPLVLDGGDPWQTGDIHVAPASMTRAEVLEMHRSPAYSHRQPRIWDGTVGDFVPVASLDLTVEQVVAAATRLADAIDMQEAFAHAASYVRPDDW
jgi:hypothetical protein